MTAQKLTKITAGKESIRYRINALYCPINTPVQQSTYRKLVPVDKKTPVWTLVASCKFPKAHAGIIELTAHVQSPSQEFNSGTPNRPSAITITVANAIEDKQSFFCSGVRKLIKGSPSSFDISL